ncbi:hypothetical protein D6777_00200 [Candidatus Woesearchaeota archaeon]|nr:MAG: hypothetical protein D6777_00200 [Candidatus Woesearchaeota archaeon]
MENKKLDNGVFRPKQTGLLSLVQKMTLAMGLSAGIVIGCSPNAREFSYHKIYPGEVLEVKIVEDTKSSSIYLKVRSQDGKVLSYNTTPGQLGFSNVNDAALAYSPGTRVIQDCEVIEKREKSCVDVALDEGKSLRQCPLLSQEYKCRLSSI